MGLFSRNKMSKDAGQWAAKAMGCMVFADGQASDAEIEAAHAQVATNPVLKNSLGSQKAGALFNETVAAIGPIIGAMLPAYESELTELASKVDDLNEKNFALATLIAVALGDRALSDGEYNMLVRFRDMLGATIPLPQPGDVPPAEYRRVAAVTPAEAGGQAAAQAEAGGAAEAVTCPSCGQPTQFYEGYGHWCAPCERYAEVASQGVAADAAAGAATAGAEAEQVAQVVAADSSAAGSAAVVSCASCGKPTQLYEGYGYWCNDCRQYAQVS